MLPSSCVTPAGTSIEVQNEWEENTHTHTFQKKIDEGHSIERVWHSASRELSDTLPGSQPCTQTRSIYHILSGFQFSLTAQSTSLRESLGWSNQRGSKTSQACYSHPRCNLNLVRLFRFSLLLPLIGCIFFFPYPRGHKPTTPFVYYVIPRPRVLQYPVTPNGRRSSATQSVHYFSFPPGPRFPAFSSSPDMTLLGNLWSSMRSSAPAHNNLLVRTVASMLSHWVR